MAVAECVVDVVEQRAKNFLAECVLGTQGDPFHMALIVSDGHVGKVDSVHFRESITEAFKRQSHIPRACHLALCGASHCGNALQFAVGGQVIAELVVFGGFFDEQGGHAGKVFIDHCNVILCGLENLCLTHTFNESALRVTVLNSKNTGNCLSSHWIFSLCPGAEPVGFDEKNFGNVGVSQTHNAAAINGHGACGICQ